MALDTTWFDAMSFNTMSFNTRRGKTSAVCAAPANHDNGQKRLVSDQAEVPDNRTIPMLIWSPPDPNTTFSSSVSVPVGVTLVLTE